MNVLLVVSQITVSRMTQRKPIKNVKPENLGNLDLERKCQKAGKVSKLKSESIGIHSESIQVNKNWACEYLSKVTDRNAGWMSRSKLKLLLNLKIERTKMVRLEQVGKGRLGELMKEELVLHKRKWFLFSSAADVDAVGCYSSVLLNSATVSFSHYRFWLNDKAVKCRNF